MRVRLRLAARTPEPASSETFHATRVALLFLDPRDGPGGRLDGTNLFRATLCAGEAGPNTRPSGAGYWLLGGALSCPVSVQPGEALVAFLGQQEVLPRLLGGHFLAEVESQFVQLFDAGFDLRQLDHAPFPAGTPERV